MALMRVCSISMVKTVVLADVIPLGNMQLSVLLLQHVGNEAC